MKSFNHYYVQFLRATHLQLALTLIAFPVFLYWGLPLSITTYIATLLFSPFLTVFLLLSTLIFFSELLSIPNFMLYRVLQIFGDMWLYLLSYSNASWLIGFACPPVYILLLMPIITIFILTHTKLRSMRKNTLALGFITLFFAISLKIYPYVRNIQNSTIECGKKNIVCIADGHTTILIDQSCLARKVTIDNWIQYTLCNSLFYKTGSLHITCFIAYTTSNRLLQAISQMAHVSNIKLVYIPFDPSITTMKNHLFRQCVETLSKRGTKLICVEYDTNIVLNLKTQVQLQFIKKKTSGKISVDIFIDDNRIYF